MKEYNKQKEKADKLGKAFLDALDKKLLKLTK